MPEIHYRPSQSAQFKSSIRSSQPSNGQHEEHASTSYDLSGWPTSISAASLDSRHWTYLAEGAKNLLLRYEGPTKHPFVDTAGRRLALRLSKVDRKKKSDLIKGQEDDSIEASEWRDSVLQLDLASIGAVPQLLRVHDDSQDGADIKTFVREMMIKVEARRPRERRRANGLEETASRGIFAIEDLSASIDGKQVVVFEVKPKCGFLPLPATLLSPETAPLKKRFSRYRMHRVLKCKTAPTLEEFEKYFDPLDLCSGERERIKKAAEALYQDWTHGEGNLRIFINGRRVEANQIDHLDVIAKDMFLCDSLQDMLSLKLASKEVGAVLQRLVQLQQKYDYMDVEGVASLYQSTTGKSLAEAQESPVSLAEYQEAVKSEDSQSNPRQAIVKLLLSTMYKDCSVFVRCISGEAVSSVSLVDLDPKPITKLGYLEQLDKDVCHNFRSWSQQVGLGCI